MLNDDDIGQMREALARTPRLRDILRRMVG
jgi:hypothetical protein